MIKAENEKVRELFLYVQERCLWQFVSRAWDREANIENITRMTGDLILGEKPKIETAIDKQYYADAIELVSGLKQRVRWVFQESPDDLRAILDGLKDELLDLAVKSATNNELNWQLY
jgi:nitrogenase delta subunit